MDKPPLFDNNNFLFHRTKTTLIYAADRAYPVFRNILKRCTRRDTAIRISNLGIIDISAGITYILLHCFLLSERLREAAARMSDSRLPSLEFVTLRHKFLLCKNQHFRVIFHSSSFPSIYARRNRTRVYISAPLLNRLLINCCAVLPEIPPWLNSHILAFAHSCSSVSVISGCRLASTLTISKNSF